MPDILEKLRPDCDLQCYYERPSAIAALSATSATGFTVSGTWRQQFDWAVVEWNRDNVFEHPLFRNLPDGDLSGLRLSYEETRTNCLALDSDIYPTVDWPYLRISCGNDIYRVSLKEHAIPVEGGYGSATAVFELQGTPTTNDYVGFAWLDEHCLYRLYGVDTLETTSQALTDSINTFSTTMTAMRDGTRITLIRPPETGANSNRVGVYSLVAGSKTESWQPVWQTLSGGSSPTKWRIDLDFSNLKDIDGRVVPTHNVRKLRWTFAADLQHGAFERTEFQVVISAWQVSGNNRTYEVAGPGSRRIEDTAVEVTYNGTWKADKGNFSGGTIHSSAIQGDSVICRYQAAQAHRLYLGTRLAATCATIAVSIDGQALTPQDLQVPGEDVLVRLPLGSLGPGPHEITATHAGPPGADFYIDFFEVAVPTTNLPAVSISPRTTLATDWDTDHSMALAPERTAGIMERLGFHGRANHYNGALWFYELTRRGHNYASQIVCFVGTPEANKITTLTIGNTDNPDLVSTIQHLNLEGDTLETIAKAFEFEINQGYTAIWALADGPALRINARQMGAAGNKVTLSGTTNGTNMSLQIATSALTGGTDGYWITDVSAVPRLNRAIRDWGLSYFSALKGAGIEAAAAFSMELQHGDPASDAGLAQRYPSGQAVQLNTPAVQTNFSPVSLAFWRQVYLEMAQLLQRAGQDPFLQFGEVQWWYFPDDGSGMAFYDAYTKDTFRTTYGRDLDVISGNLAGASQYPQACEFLPTLIGNFTTKIMSFVRAGVPGCRFEVLYPTDVNSSPLNTAVNYPHSAWSPATLDCLKTESFTYTAARNLDLSKSTIQFGSADEFPCSKRSHLVGIGDAATVWWKEARIAKDAGFESVVLFALDQFCLIGYALPFPDLSRRSARLGR